MLFHVLMLFILILYWFDLYIDSTLTFGLRDLLCPPIIDGHRLGFVTLPHPRKGDSAKLCQCTPACWAQRAGVESGLRWLSRGKSARIRTLSSVSSAADTAN